MVKIMQTSGRGSVVIINKDGTIKTDADPFKDAVAGTEFQITVASTGYTTPLTFTYKIAETPAPAEVDTTALEVAIAEADNLKEADYTADSWVAYQAKTSECTHCIGSKGKSGSSQSGTFYFECKEKMHWLKLKKNRLQSILLLLKKQLQMQKRLKKQTTQQKAGKHCRAHFQMPGKHWKRKKARKQ